jgi:hypothetical protein
MWWLLRLLLLLLLCNWMGETGFVKGGTLMSLLDEPRRASHVKLFSLHDQHYACPSGFVYSDTKQRSPTVLYIVGHLRSFRNYTSGFLQKQFCDVGTRNLFLSTMVTRCE